jgi:hypothetical protein
VPALFSWVLAASIALAQPPLHDRIDQAITRGQADFEASAAPLATDAEFLRRVYLDLAGTIPTAEEARAFLKDTALDRRARLIDRLLASPGYARHLQHVFDVLLMDRRGAKNVPLAAWQEYLYQSFAANKPYDQMVRELFSTDGADPKTRAAARFILDRDGEPHMLTRDTGRLFLGMNLKCAQCHDHPLVPTYHQEDYYGLYAFFSRSFLFQDAAKKQKVLAEKAEGEVAFQSVFVPKVTKNTGPRLPGLAALTEPVLAKGKEYLVAPAKGIRPVPAFSRRSLLPGALLDSRNERFKRTAANRLWAMMMGRGLVQPVDFDHQANPPSHPELLRLLADELAARRFDLKAFLRELALSRTYQRSSMAKAGGKGMPDERAFAIAALRPLSPEQLGMSIFQATGLTDAERRALGPKASEPVVYAKLAGPLAAFVRVFGSQAGEPADSRSEPTLAQALFLRNGAQLGSLFDPKPGNLTDRLMKLKDAGPVAEELYLSLLTRFPTDEERKELAEYLAGRGVNRAGALRELAWAMLTSAEFRFNH